MLSREEAKKVGYSDQEYDSFVSKNASSITQQTKSKSKTQKVGGFLKSIGLGFLPKIGEAVAQTGVSLLPGSPTEYGSPEQQARQKMQGGVFLDEQQLNRASDLKTGAIDTGKDAAGLASWALPFGKVGMLGKAGLGATGGALHNISQPDTSFQGAATEAGIGAVAAPLLAKIFPHIKKPTFGRAAAAQRASATGAPLDYNRVQNVSNASVENAPRESQQAVREMLARYTPVSDSAAQNVAPAGLPRNFNLVKDAAENYAPTTMKGGPTIAPLARTDVNHLRLDKFGNTLEPMPLPTSGATHAVENPTSNLVGENSGQIAKAQWTDRQALELRQTLDKYVPSRFWKQTAYLEGDPKIQAAKVIRKAINEQLHLNKGIAEADKVLSVYSKLKGDIPTWALRLGFGAVAGKSITSKLGGLADKVVTGGQ